MSNGLSGGWAYIYEDGTFQFDGSAKINNVQILYQFRRSVKGTLDEVSLNVGHVEDYQEFQYVTAGDETVLLELGVNKALIIADFEECFITMNVPGGSEHGITEDGLKKIADEIDENGDGLVYYIMTEGEYERSKPVDMEAYGQWLNSYINGAEIVSVPYQQLTEENIASLSQEILNIFSQIRDTSNRH